MCGIAGFTTFAGARPDREAVLDAMTDAQRHRGPDGRGTYFAPAVALGHRRLSIISPQGGAQPMATADGRHVIVFNGEIYNHGELRAQLAARGVEPRDGSDTAILLALLADRGAAGLSELNGMFALALWDEREETLLLARDRLGEKPLFYARIGGDIAFASELPALLRHHGVAAEPDISVLPDFLTFGYVPAPATVYRAIRKLEPGAYLFIRRGEVVAGRYWALPFPDAEPAPRTDAAGAVRALLDDAVRLRTRSDAPWGVWLSGGLDSSIVAALAARASSARLKTFSMGFEESTYDESPHARAVAAAVGSEHEAAVLTARDVADIAPAAVLSAGEPFADASVVPTYWLSRHCARTVKTVLGGDGGDELFLGYPAFRAHRWAEALRVLPGAAAVLQRLAALLPVSGAYRSPRYFLSQFAASLAAAPETRLLAWLGCASPDQAGAVLSDEVRAACGRPDAAWSGGAASPSRIADRLVRASLRAYLQDGILVKTDRAAMASSLEVRAPFLDHRLVELACGLPASQRAPGGQSKGLLKEACRDLVPGAVLRRRKAGFMMPLAAYLRGPLLPWVRALCSEAAVRRHGWLDAAVVDRIVREHLGGRADHRKRLWSIVCLQAWLEARA